jgi:hypothetical protein
MFKRGNGKMRKAGMGTGQGGECHGWKDNG